LITCSRNHRQDRAVGIVTGLRDGRQGVRISAEVRDLSLIQNMALVLTKSPIQWVLGFFPRAKRPGRQVNSFPPTAEGKKEWRYTFTPPPALCLYGVVRHKFNFYISNFRFVLKVVFVLLGRSPASEFYVPTFRNNVCSVFIGCVYRKKELLTPPMKMEQNFSKRRHSEVSWVKSSEV